MTITIVAAVAANGVIGRNGGLPWHLPEDQDRFKRLTTGHVLVMGRRTYESIGRALPGRINVVVTRQPGWRADGVDVAASLDAALEASATHGSHVFVVGGSEIYRLALPLADAMALTMVDDCPDGDTYFPDVDWSQWREVRSEPRNGYTFVDYERS